MERLTDRQCRPCRGDEQPLEQADVHALHQMLDPEWRLVENRRIERTFRFDTYRDGIQFVNAVADLAEQQQHHPVLEVDYRQVVVKVWTHKLNALSENDFILAAKIDEAGVGAGRT